MASSTSRSQDEHSPSSVREARVAVAEGPPLTQLTVDEEAGYPPASLSPRGSQSEQAAVSTQSYLVGRGFKRPNFRKAHRKRRFCTDYLPWLVAGVSAMIFLALGVIVFILPAFNTTTTTTTTATITTTTTATKTTHTSTGSSTTTFTSITSTELVTTTSTRCTTGCSNLRSANTTTTTSSAPPSSVDDLAAAVLVSMTVENVDYEKLRDLGHVQAGFKREVAGAIASEAGRGIDADAIRVKLGPGSVRVDARVPDLDGAEAMRLQSELVESTTTLTQRVESSIQNVTGIDEACTGAVTVTNLEASAVAKTASSAGSSRFQAAAWLFGIAAACCCPLLGLLIWQHTSRGAMSKGYMPAPLAARESTSKDDAPDSKPLVSDSKVAEGKVAESPAVVKPKAKAKRKAKAKSKPEGAATAEKTENTEKTEKSEKAEKTENTRKGETTAKADQKEQKETDKSQQPSEQASQQKEQKEQKENDKSQQPSQQASEQPADTTKKKRLVRAKRRAKPEEDQKDSKTDPGKAKG